MVDEKVTVVKMMLIKLAALVPRGYSKSTDKIAQHLIDQGNSEVNQFMDETNEAIQSRRFLDPTKITVKLKDEEEEEEEKKDDKEESKKDEETKAAKPKAGRESGSVT